MITIFKNKKDIPQNKEYIELNDIYGCKRYAIASRYA